MVTPILKNEAEILKHLKKNLPPSSKDFICFYSSHLKAIITDPLFFSIPLEDKLVHRGYGVFDTTKIFGSKIYQLDSHLDRFMGSIKKVNLNSLYTKEEFKEVLMQMASISRQIEPEKDIELRYFYSAGLGNLSVLVNDNMNSFYAVALRTDFSQRPVQGVEETLVYLDPIKKDISSSKTTNYLLNALVTKHAREDGGYLGIMVDEDGSMLESPMSNIAFVLNNGTFSVPPFDKTLTGTTIIRLLEHVTNDLIPNGHLASIARDYVNVSNFSAIVKEAMFAGGDFVIPILKINDVTISENPGPITKMLQDFLLKDKNTEDVAEDIPVLLNGEL